MHSQDRAVCMWCLTAESVLNGVSPRGWTGNSMNPDRLRRVLDCYGAPRLISGVRDGRLR